MTSSVKIKSNPTISSNPLACSTCGKTDPKLLKCSGCHFTKYCRRDCQKADWPKHKKVCKIEEKKIGLAHLGLPIQQKTKNWLETKENQTVLGPHHSSVLWNEMDKLVEQVTSKSLMIHEASAAADVLIEQLVDLSKRNLSLARDGLCRLLKLNIEEVQLKVIQQLKPLLSLKLLSYDVENDQSQPLLALEKQVSEVIVQGAQSNSSEFLLPFIDLYKDILERLWLLPDLIEDKSSYALIVEKNGASIINRAQEWLKLLLKENIKDEKIAMTLKSLPKMLQRIITPLPSVTKNIAELKPNLDSPIISAFVGDICQGVGDFRRAIVHYQESLESINPLKMVDPKEQLTLKKIEGSILDNLGLVYQSLGEFHKAIEFQEKRLQIAQALKDRAGEARAYGNLGNAYHSLGEFRKAIEFHEKALQIAQALKDRAGEGVAYTNLGIAYRSLGEVRKAIECHEKHLQIAQTLEDRAGEGVAYGSLGIAYHSLGEFRKAVEFHEKALQIAQALERRDEEAVSFYHFGVVYALLPDLQKSEYYFHQSIQIYSLLQHKLGDNNQWKITIFERQSASYMGLEMILLLQNKIEEALQITDSRRSRALVAALSKRLKKEPPLADTLMTFQDIQALAQRLKTTFVVYSLLGKSEKMITAWVVSSKGEMTCQSIPAHTLPEGLKEASTILTAFPFITESKTELPQRRRFLPSQKTQDSPKIPLLEEMKALSRGDSTPVSEENLQKFKSQLTQLYESLISPIEKYLPKDPEQTVTIIPDNFLSQLPFAAFRDQEGKYLIEKHPISIAPSLKVLQLLDQLPRDFLSSSLIIGNPSSPHTSALKLAEEEAYQIVAPLLKTPKENILVQKHPTVLQVMEEMPQARWIHFAYHGEADQKFDVHSIFEGLLKLAADEKHSEGYLYAQHITPLMLQAELVFLSACFSGRGKIQQEGSIGPIWSFLAAGALSTVATYWRLPEEKLTLQMVETFYRRLLGVGTEKLNKAQALQRAMKMAIEKERENPHKWGAFFLSGLHE